MTDLETLELAKSYMERLANGIHPITGTAIPDGDVVNDVRLSRCFFYVADVLRQVIERGGVTPKKKTQKAAFALPLELRSAIDLSPTPIPISEIARRINTLVDKQAMATLPYRSITNWLLSIELLEETVSISGRPTKHPTAKGEELGIFSEDRMGSGGPYVVVLYAIEAQQFIVDNLDVIAEFGHAEKEKHRQPWSKEHDEMLADLYQKGTPIKEIAITLKRSNGSIRSRLKKQNLL